MAIEIERKFLVSGDEWRGGPAGIAYRQGYLAREAGVTVRVRLGGERAWLTVKGAPDGIARAEFEYAIPVHDAGELLALCPDPPVEKVRYLVMHGGRRWEVDEFHGANAGLLVAEIELQDPGAEIDLPNWVGEEVSDDPRYTNAELARHPFTAWGTP